MGPYGWGSTDVQLPRSPVCSFASSFTGEKARAQPQVFVVDEKSRAEDLALASEYVTSWQRFDFGWRKVALD